MAFSTSQGKNLLRGFVRPGKFDEGVAKRLPEAYKKFWREWKETEPTAVHYIPSTEKWERNPITNEVKIVQNVPIPLKYPKEFHEGFWGGEAVIKGFQKRGKFNRRVPHFWVPVLKRSVIYSEILDKYMSTIVTERTIKLIHENYGLDHYLLKSLACDLMSKVALRLKRQILLDLKDKCPAYNDKPELKLDIYNKYKQYLDGYTDEELEWYGLTFSQALRKLEEQEKELNKPKPLKHQLRLELIERLKISQMEQNKIKDSEKLSTNIWLDKINPFSKKQA